MNISTRLDEAMRKAGFSQSGLSRASGVPQPTINRILKGPNKRGPETATLRRLAQACNVTFEWLNEGVGDPSRSAAGRNQEVTPLPVEPVAPESWLQRVNTAEAELLEIFRSMDKVRQAGVIGYLKIMAKDSRPQDSPAGLDQAERGAQRK